MENFGVGTYLALEKYNTLLKSVPTSLVELNSIGKIHGGTYVVYVRLGGYIIYVYNVKKTAYAK